MGNHSNIRLQVHNPGKCLSLIARFRDNLPTILSPNNLAQAAYHHVMIVRNQETCHAPLPARCANIQIWTLANAGILGTS
jgi:hypothetical protein